MNTKLVAENLNEFNKDKPLTYKKITGRVGNKDVTAFVYPGKDSGLSHYKVDGKNYMGIVEFTEVYSKKDVKY